MVNCKHWFEGMLRTAILKANLDGYEASPFEVNICANNVFVATKTCQVIFGGRNKSTNSILTNQFFWIDACSYAVLVSRPNIKKYQEDHWVRERE